MNNLKKALENVMRRDVERFENAAEHEFSAEFERKMSELSARVSQGARPKRLRIVRIFAAAAAAAALFAVGTLAGAVSSGFNVTRTTGYNLPAKLFTAADTEGCPTTIETVYVLDGFSMNPFSISNSKDGATASSTYYPAPVEELYNDELYMEKVVHLDQMTKETFEFKYTDMEYVTYKQLTVNGGQAYFITRERFYGMQAYLLWESEDYIFTLTGSFSEERALELANSLAVYDGEMPYSGIREV